MKQLPENGEVIEKILLLESDHPDINPVDLVDLLRHSDSLLRERSCYFLLWISKTQKIEVMKILWSFKVKDTLEALMYDSMEAVRNVSGFF